MPRPKKKPPARKKQPPAKPAPPKVYPTVSITIELGPRVLHRLKYALIRGVTIECGGNITQAAELLGVHRQSLQRLLDGANEEP